MANDNGDKLGGEQFDEAMEQEKIAKAKDQLLDPKGTAKDSEGKEFPVCLLEIEVKKIRNVTTHLLRVVNPTAYAEYKAMKQADASLAGKRKAYAFAFTKLLEVGYNISGL